MVRKVVLVMLLILAMGCAGAQGTSSSGEAPRMTKDQLKAGLGKADLVVLDVRSPQDWAKGEGKIAGAVREDPREFDNWAGKYPKDKTLVLYCA